MVVFLLALHRVITSAVFFIHRLLPTYPRLKTRQQQATGRREGARLPVDVASVKWQAVRVEVVAPSVLAFFSSPACTVEEDHLVCHDLSHVPLGAVRAVP